MIGNVFVVVMIGVLVLLALHEVWRHYWAQHDDQAIPYPRRRLSRRLGAAMLLIATLLLVQFWPTGVSLAVHLGLLVAVVLLLVLAVVVVLRDLHETSRAVVEYAAHSDLEQALREALEAGQRAAETEKRRDCEGTPPPSNTAPPRD